MWINFDEEFLPALGALCSCLALFRVGGWLERFSSSLFSRLPLPLRTYLLTSSRVPINPFKPTPPTYERGSPFLVNSSNRVNTCNELSPIIREFLCTNLDFVSSSQSIGSFFVFMQLFKLSPAKRGNGKKTQLRSKIQALMQHNFAWKLLLTAPSPIHQYAATPIF